MDSPHEAYSIYISEIGLFIFVSVFFLVIVFLDISEIINCNFPDGARGRLRNALIADSDDFAPIMGGGRFQLQTEDQESGISLLLHTCIVS